MSNETESVTETEKSVWQPSFGHDKELHHFKVLCKESLLPNELTHVVDGNWKSQPPQTMMWAGQDLAASAVCMLLSHRGQACL